MIDNEVLREQLRQTELALEDATDMLEISRAAMRVTILEWHDQGRTWEDVKEHPLWKAFEKIGGS